MPESDERQAHGRLGKLFAALVGDGTTAPDASRPDPADDACPFDVDELARSLATASDPVGVLRVFVASIRSRSERAEAGDGTEPSGLELYLAERLAEAGLFADDVELPALRVVRPRTSDLFYLRIDDDELPGIAKLRVVRLEAALNGALLATRVLPDEASHATLEELVRCEQRCARSIVAQAATVAERRSLPAYGEWDVREAISTGIESFRLPYRLTARFRVNVAAGVAAFEIDLVPPRAWARTRFVDALGVVGATTQMRRRAATDYNLRLGVLLAAYALRVAPELREVWVAGVIDGAGGHACYYSGCLDRALLRDVDLAGPPDPLALMRSAGVTLDEHAGELTAVHQSFSLNDERFCPAARFDAPETSPRTLTLSAAEALGCARVRDLGADDQRARADAASELLRDLSGSTAANVSALLALQRSTDQPDVAEAALRCVRELVDGTLEDDPYAIAESLVAGDELTRLAAEAQGLLAARDLVGAGRTALDAVERFGERYLDDGAHTWRVFDDYAERVVYNRLVAQTGEQCSLAPTALLEAHLVASAAELGQGQLEAAVGHARRARDLAPTSPQASLHLAHCLEAAGDLAGATAEISRLLSLVHEPEAAAVAYLRMAQAQWQGGRVLAAQACYQRATQLVGAPVVVAGLAVVALVAHVGDATESALSPDQTLATLRGASIPIAPTDEVASVLLEGAKAALDEGVFPVARDLTRSLCKVLRDDVTFGVLRSIEDEPDR